MKPTAKYPNGYVRYYNEYGQPNRCFWGAGAAFDDPHPPGLPGSMVWLAAVSTGALAEAEDRWVLPLVGRTVDKQCIDFAVNLLFARGPRFLSNKTMVLGVIERGGKVRFDVSPSQNASSSILKRFVNQHVSDEAAAITTTPTPVTTASGTRTRSTRLSITPPRNGSAVTFIPIPSNQSGRCWIGPSSAHITS